MNTKDRYDLNSLQLTRFYIPRWDNPIHDEKLNENHAGHGNEWINQGVLEKLNSYRG